MNIAEHTKATKQLDITSGKYEEETPLFYHPRKGDKSRRIIILRLQLQPARFYFRA